MNLVYKGRHNDLKVEIWKSNPKEFLLNSFKVKISNPYEKEDTQTFHIPIGIYLKDVIEMCAYQCDEW